MEYLLFAIKRKLTDLDKMKIEEQKKAVRAGYDMDIIPSDLATYGNEAKTLLEDLQNRNERMFLVTILLMNTAEKRQKLENNVFQAAGIAQKYNFLLCFTAFKLSARTRVFIFSSAWCESDYDQSGAYDKQHSNFCTVYYTGAFSERRSFVLWSKCSFQ